MTNNQAIEVGWNEDLDLLLEGWSASPLDWVKVRGDVLEVVRMKRRKTGHAEVTFEDVCSEVLDQLASRLDSTIWAHLPGKIMDYVVNSIIASLPQRPDRRLKHILSSLSLVCRQWSAQCRPFLFHHLILAESSDSYRLHTILASPTSSWLRNHIHTIAFKQVGSTSNPESSQSLCVNELPHVSRISYAYQNRLGGKGHIIPLSLRTLWRNTRLPLTSLQLETYRFHSVSVLLRTLGALRYLEDVQLYRVSWTVESNLDAVLQSRCRADFSLIRRVCVAECQEVWPFAWMFAVASMGHKLRFLRRGEETTVPEDVMMVIRLCKMFWDPKYRTSVIQKQEPSEAGDYIFQYRLAHGDGNCPVQERYELAFVAKPVGSSVESDDSLRLTRTLNCLVISVSPSLSFDTVNSFAWNTVDTILAGSHSLSSVDILCGSTFSPDQVELLSTNLVQRIARANVCVRHTPDFADATTLEPELFKRRTYVSESDVSHIFVIDPIGSIFSAPKYVRL